MKTARVILVLLLVLAIRPAAKAQPVISGYFVNSSWYDTDSKAEPGFSGFQGDLMWSFPFNKILGLNLGGGYLWLNRKQEPLVINGNAAESYTREQHIRLPIHFVINIPLSQSFGLQLFMGGCGSAAISGMNVLSIATDSGTGLVTHDYYSGLEGRKGVTDSEYSAALPFLETTPDMSRYDVQAEAGFGIRISSFLMFRGGYSYGIFNRLKNSSDGFLRRNQINAGLTLLF